MDIATLLGIISAFGLVLVAILMGGGIGLFINYPSLMIVAGGTLGTTMINYPLKEVIGVISVLKNVFFTKASSAKDIIKQFSDFSNKARREGILALESEVTNLNEEFLQKGIQLSIDGLEPQSIREILETEISYIQDRHKLGAEIFTTMGTYAPALGMVGTLVGLVQMLQNMSDPSAIGPAMAVALLTTFYGAVAANLLFMPIAGKLRTRSSEEVLVKELMIEGVICLSNGENPRIVEQKLMAFLAPNQRETEAK
ncbi:MAG: flagellar motor protein [Deltaproteobacteria bacterium]|nr:flagellar motor protein [Deltaproteobacteria bacterium]MBW2601289.1 flagellar motor protein [Deltaproteobacteria bacterium]